MQVVQTNRSVTPAEQYLRMLFAARWPFAGIVVGYVVAAAIVTALQPKLYSSQAILSVQPAPQLEAAAGLYGSAILGNRETKPDDPNAPQRQTGPGRYAPRLAATGLVTLAARDAGLIGMNEALDGRQVTKWVSAQGIDRSDLIVLTVSQPAPDAAQKLAGAIVARVLEANRIEQVAAPTRQLLADELKKALPAMDEAERAVVRESSGRGGAEHDVKLERAKLDLSLAREQYAAVHKRIAVLDLIVADQQLQLAVVDAPTLPAAPSSPQRALNLSVGFVLGVLTGTAFIALRNVFRRV